ncbi:heterokaryon incompatibility protein-domain-containing protein [Aspergillus multicolor]|uniref:heterokaryon incompatibility protein-domain-containing protein n=1 Tax=Aspergillus multicolor TaxID=41759 RepID=UPI003CCE4ED6
MNPDLCNTCRKIDFDALLLGDGATSLHRFEHETVYLGTLDDIWHQALDGCPFCADIVIPRVHEVARDALSNASSSPSEPSNDSVFLALVVKNSRFSYLSLVVSHCPKEFYVGIDIRFDKEDPPAFALAQGTLVRGSYDHYLVTCEQPVRLLDHPLSAYKTLEPRVDRQLLGSWFDTCSGQHQTGRRIPDSGTLDSLNEDAHRPATLSYVCGEAYTLRTLKESEDWAQRDDGILIHPLPMELPSTIEDALIVTANLGLQYLWVDSTCIAQDNSEEKQAQILDMHDIYARPEICIVAKSGNNCKHGLPGARVMRQLPASAAGAPLRAGQCSVVGPL